MVAKDVNPQWRKQGSLANEPIQPAGDQAVAQADGLTRKNVERNRSATGPLPTQWLRVADSLQ